MVAPLLGKGALNSTNYILRAEWTDISCAENNKVSCCTERWLHNIISAVWARTEHLTLASTSNTIEPSMPRAA